MLCGSRCCAPFYQKMLHSLTGAREISTFSMRIETAAIVFKKSFQKTNQSRLQVTTKLQFLKPFYNYIQVPVSIWRTYFVANEWNEIQAVRKINKTFQVWAAVFFLVVVGFENTATKDPDGGVQKNANDFKADYSRVYRYALAVLVYVIIGRFLTGLCHHR